MKTCLLFLGCAALLLFGSACSGEIGAAGGGGAASTSVGGQTTGSGGEAGSAGSSTAGSGTGGAAAGGGTGGASTSSSGGTGGSSSDPCSGAGDGNHCGGELGGNADHNSLYACAGGMTSSVSACPNGCQDGACVQPPGDPCANANAGNGAYCAESLGAGTPGTLYTCQGNVKVGEIMCPNGCQVQPPGTPDNCKSSGDPCVWANAGDGLYCGGSLKDGATPKGDPNILYDCKSKATIGQTVCPNGCQMNPAGQADACAPVNGQCCLNKPPGALTQSYSACGNGGSHYGIDYGTPENTPIYAGMSGTVVGSALGFPNCYDNGCSSSCWNSFNYVKLKSDCGDPVHPGNDLFIYYLHINDLGPGVGNGTHVDKGQLLALSGNSGCSSGPHIHIETTTVAAGGSASLSTCKSEDPADRYCP